MKIDPIKVYLLAINSNDFKEFESALKQNITNRPPTVFIKGSLIMDIDIILEKENITQSAYDLDRG